MAESLETVTTSESISSVSKAGKNVSEDILAANKSWTQFYEDNKSWEGNGVYYYDGYYDYGNYTPGYPCGAFESVPVPPGFRLCIQILLPIICSVGIIGIILTVIVLSRKNMSTSTNLYLISLAVTDLCLLLIMLGNVAEDKWTQEHHHYLYQIVMNYLHIFLQILLFASVWLTVMLAIERYIAICHPLRAMSICTVVRARLIIVGIFVVATLCRLPLFFHHKITSFTVPCSGKTVSWLALTDLGRNITYLRAYGWGVNCFLNAILPFSVLLFLNGCLIREIHRSTIYLRYHLAIDSNVQTIITSEEVKITMMLISVIVVFFICQAPYVLLAAIASIVKYTLFHHYHLLRYIAMLLLALRSSFNFILYCWFSEKFWNTFKRTFCLPACILARTPRWFQSQGHGKDSEHNGHSNNNPAKPVPAAVKNGEPVAV